jgi:TATA-box binding protein (TBP) (component of TFIID and TFIIIB)
MDNIRERGNTIMKEILEIALQIPAKLSTITIGIKINTTFNLERISADFNNDKIQDFIYDVTGDKHNITMSNKKNFYNCIIFKCHNIPTEEEGYILNKQSVKIFCNGSIHITGVKDIKDALYLAEVFITMIELLYGGNGISDMFQISGFEVQLMNFYFKLPGMLHGMVLKLNDVMNYLRININYAVSYNNEHHVGVIIRAPVFSVLIFDTGNVIICSIKEPQQLLEASRFIKEKIFPLTDHCMVTKVDMPIRKRLKKENTKFDYSKYLVLK